MSIAMPPVPCTDNHELFDSTYPWDHRLARTICATCPAVQACIERAVKIANEHAAGNHMHRGPDGTWGGLLWVGGSVVLPNVQAQEVAA